MEREQITRKDLAIFATKADISFLRKELKQDLKRFATKDDLKRFATKDDLKHFATKDDLKRFATKDDLKHFATKDDLKRFATKDDLDNLELNIQKDFQRSSEIFSTKTDLKEMSYNLMDYMDRKFFELKGDNHTKHQKIIKASKHTIAVVGRHHNEDTIDKKDILAAIAALDFSV